MVEKIVDAHKGPIYSISVKPDSTGIVTGSADQTVKFWDFQLAKASQNIDGSMKQMRKLHLMIEKVIKMNNEVLCVKCSPSGKFLAVSLLDSTVKVFFLDSLKFFLSLYGHKVRPASLPPPG